jgi:hypothetical protein
VDHLQLQRAEHHRERLAQRVPARAGRTCRPTSRRGWRQLPLLRPGHRHEPAADLPGVLQRAGTRIRTPGAYVGRCSTNTTFLNPLARFNPNPYTFGNNLDNDATRGANALAAGLPANFLRANPDKLGGANVYGHGGFSNYNSVQFELRRRLANGFQFDASYVYGVGDTSARYSFRVPRETVKRAGLTEGEVTHAFKANWMLELPFGQGKRFAATPAACSTASSAAGRSTATPASRAASGSTSATSAWSASTRRTCGTCTSCGSTRTSACSCCRRT